MLGTPDEKSWPGYLKLEFYKKNLPRFKGKKLGDLIPKIDKDGLDLISKMLKLNPEKRISALKALDHPYFDSLDKENI